MADKKQNNRRNRNNGDDDFNPRFRKVRKKVCPLCSDKNLVLDYKNADQLKKFINVFANIKKKYLQSKEIYNRITSR